MNKTAWLAAALVLCLTPMASASVTIVGNTAKSTESLGNFKATLTYAFTNATTATLQVVIENTSPVDNGGYLTAFVFNNPDNLITGVTLTEDSSFPDFDDVLGGATFQDLVNGQPFGDFDIGLSTGGSFQGGGNPNKGIGVGETGDFLFHLAGTGLDQLTEQDFLSTLSKPRNENGEKEPQFFVARFRGFEDEGSDKVPGTEVVPEPASLAVWGCIGLVGVPYGIYRRRRALTA